MDRARLLWIWPLMLVLLLAACDSTDPARPVSTSTSRPAATPTTPPATTVLTGRCSASEFGTVVLDYPPNQQGAATVAEALTVWMALEWDRRPDWQVLTLTDWRYQFQRGFVHFADERGMSYLRVEVAGPLSEPASGYVVSGYDSCAPTGDEEPPFAEVTNNDLSVQAGTWLNSTGLNQRDSGIWRWRLHRACSEGVWNDTVAHSLAEEFVAMDQGLSVRAASAGPVDIGDAAQALWTMAANVCRDAFPDGEIEQGPPVL